MSDLVAAWRTRGALRQVGGREIFIVDTGEPGTGREPLLLIHGFPSSSFDWRSIVDGIAATRRVIALDLPGYGLSEKPLDADYSLFTQTDVVVDAVKALGVDRFAMMTHDMGDTVGGELLARVLEGSLAVTVTERVVTNGSIYMELVQLSAGQQLMLAMPDAALPPDQAPGYDLFAPSLAFTFGPDTQPDEDELRAQWALVSARDGHRLLPRLIRYVEERRRHEDRWTGAIEKHDAPLRIIWGELDPIAVLSMASRLAERTGAPLEILDGIGHYPMIEAPDRFVAATGLA